MKITALKIQARNQSRVNVYVDGSYSFSLDIAQVSQLNVKTNCDYSAQQIAELQSEGEFSKLYARALEYSLVRPRSSKELKDYLYRKTRPVKLKTGATRPGYRQEAASRVFERLSSKGYLNDQRFARYWVENRNINKGISTRKLRFELMAKGVDSLVIDEALREINRDELEDIRKVIERKQKRYPDEQKFIAYLARQGFSYDDIKEALNIS